MFRAQVEEEELMTPELIPLGHPREAATRKPRCVIPITWTRSPTPATREMANNRGIYMKDVSH